jgi:hypothetical protein
MPFAVAQTEILATREKRLLCKLLGLEFLANRLAKKRWRWRRRWTQMIRDVPLPSGETSMTFSLR